MSAPYLPRNTRFPDIRLPLKLGAFLIATLGTTLLSGCASLCNSSTFSQLGPDTYQASGVCGGPTEAATAGTFCARMGKKVLVTNTRGYNDGGATIFRCLNADDPEYARPTYQRSPNVIIQDNRK